ncbi:hypothetical protein TRVL_05318 [Trypanosoma vivax]|nr:hypothetical protein TRVL_05318 [Trypanosoma vivax]
MRQQRAEGRLGGGRDVVVGMRDKTWIGMMCNGCTGTRLKASACLLFNATVIVVRPGAHNSHYVVYVVLLNIYKYTGIEMGFCWAFFFTFLDTTACLVVISRVGAIF